MGSKAKFIKQFIKDAIISFIYWTLALSPYNDICSKDNLRTIYGMGWYASHFSTTSGSNFLNTSKKI
jgi:hypothetical protein